MGSGGASGRTSSVSNSVAAGGVKIARSGASSTVGGNVTMTSSTKGGSSGKGVGGSTGKNTPSSAGGSSGVSRIGTDEDPMDGVHASGGSSSVSGTARPTSADRPTYAEAALVENTGADCTVAALPEPGKLPKISKLPDPFKKLDGTRISKKSEWRCRRQEIEKQAERYIYGEKPAKPSKVTGGVTKNKISVEAQDQGKTIRFAAEVVLPSKGQGPFSAIINVGARSGFGGITLGENLLLNQGVGIVFYNHYELGVEGTPEQSRGKPNAGLFYDLYGGSHSAGLLMAWAWGASRLIDVLQEFGADFVDSERLGVTGCSRNGKGAFAIGIFDERIALTIPQETSTAGVPAYRVVDTLNGAELTKYNYNGLNWLSNNFGPFVMNTQQLPLDSHELVAMVAPRGLLVLDNPHIQQFAAPAGHVAVLAGAEVYRALGAAANVSYISAVSNTNHCAPGKPEYTQQLAQSIAKFLKHSGEGPGQINAASNGTGNLSQWKDWQTPTLQDDLASQTAPN